MQYDNSSDDTCREMVVRSLKRWCLDGRLAQHRAAKVRGQLSHKDMPRVPSAELADDEHLNAQLRQALMSAEWVQLPPDAGAQDDT